MKIKQIADKGDKELTTLIGDQRAKLADLAVKFRTAKVSNVKEIKNARRVLARALTIARERTIAAEEQADE